MLKPLWQFALNLRGKTKDKTSFDTETFNEAVFLEESQTIALMSIAWFHLLKMRIMYLYGNYSEAMRHGAEAEPAGRRLAGGLCALRHVYPIMPLRAGQPGRSDLCPRLQGRQDP